MKTLSMRFRVTAWFAGLLTALFLLFGAFVYFTLEHFLETNLRDSIANEAKTIGEALIRNMDETSEADVAHEIEEHFAPRITGRFIRVTRPDGSVMYQSSAPDSGAFDPKEIGSGAPGGESSWREERLQNGKKFLIHSLPFANRNGRPYLIQSGAAFEQVERVLDGLLASLGVAFPLMVGVAVGGGYLLVRNGLKPLDEIATRAEQITSRNLNERMPAVGTGDELEKLTMSLNRMMERLEEAFHHINRFSADASQEIRTPLAIIRGELEAAYQSSGLTQELRETIGSGLEEAERLSKIVGQLLEISRLEAGETLSDRTRFDLTEMTRVTLDQMRLLADEKGVQLRLQSTEPVFVNADPLRLQQVVINLVDNAIKCTPSGGSIRVSTFSKDNKALLEVADTGIGIPAAALPHIFERFYRVDKARSRQLGGAGLGLAIVKSICAAYGGSVRAESVEARGATFRVDLPLEHQHSA